MVSRCPGGVSLYLQVAEELKRDLAKLRYGEQIPPETELMERYNVSRGTVRQAVNGLVSNGYLYKVQGKGTYRGGGLPSCQGYNRLPSYSRSVMLSGKVPTISNVCLQSVPADETVANYLSVPIGEVVWKLSRNRGVRGEKVSCYAEAYIPKDILPELQADDLELSLIDMILRKFQLKISSTTNQLRAVIAGDAYAAQFGIDAQEAVLMSIFVMHNEVGRPIVYDWSLNWDGEFNYMLERIYSPDMPCEAELSAEAAHN